MKTSRVYSMCVIAGLIGAGCSSDSDAPSDAAKDGGGAVSPGDDAGEMDDTPATGLDPDAAPVASVDRFQDSFGKLFKRSAPAFDPEVLSAVIPGPNEPIQLDDFLVKAWGPSGEALLYYSLDIVADEPAKAYVIVDEKGDVLPDQLPIIDGVPGDSTYNDFVLVTELTVKPSYVVNSLTSFDDVESALEAGEVTAKETTRIENWSVVPEGTTAKLKFLGKSPVGYRAWTNHEVAHFLLFDTNLTVANGKIPTSPIIVIFKNDMSPAEGFLTDDDGMTHNAVATVPGQPGYSSYWDHSVGYASGFDDVVDFASAQDNVREKVPVIVNCPIVE